MEEKDYKKLYEDVIALAKDGLKDELYLSKSAKDVTEFLFPQLKETEDEKVRRKLTSFLINFNNGYYSRPSENEIDSWIKWIDKKCEQKSQGKSALEVWKDMRSEVYQQASGNRHEPNYSDNTTKMFSIDDIDEIFEKVAENQCEQKSIDKVDVLMSLDEAIEHCKEKSCGNNACALEHKQLEKWLTELKELKEKKSIEQDTETHDKVEQKFKVGDIISDGNSEVGIVSIDGNKYNVTNGEIENDANICNWVIYFKDQENWNLVNKSCSEENEKHQQSKQEWSLSYRKNETAEKLIALAECLELDGDCLYNGLSGDDYGKLLRSLAKELTEIKPDRWSEEDEKMWSLVINEIEALKSNSSTIFEKNIAQDKIDWLNSIKDRVQPQPKQEWSEEDENLYTWCMAGIQTRYNDGLFTTSEYSQTKLWLKSLKDRVQQPKQEWSKYDEVRLTSTIQKLEYAKSLNAYNEYGKDSIIKNIDWLKSLRPQFHWKPTDKQMEAIKYFIDFHRPQANASIEGWKEFKHLESLYNDLEKL